jgi:hypothetical protein
MVPIVLMTFVYWHRVGMIIKAKLAKLEMEAAKAGLI